MKTPQLHIDKSIYFGLQKSKKHLKFTFLITILQVFLLLVSYSIEYFGPSNENNYNSLLYFGLTFLLAIFGIFITLGLTQESLKIVDNKIPTFKKIFKVKLSLFLKYILQIITSLVLGLLAILIIGGLVALTGVLFTKTNYIMAIITSILAILSLLFSIWMLLSLTVIKYTLVDQDCTVLESFKQSYNLSLKQKFSIIGFNIAKSIVWVLGFLLLGVGLLVAYPVTQFATAHFYRSLYSKAN